MNAPFSSRWPTALVTGASSGIGRAFAVALAERGVDLVVVARRADRLNELAESLRSRAVPGRVEVVVADLTSTEGLAVVEERLADRVRPVHLLVNNAGMGGSGPFVGQPVEHEDTEVRLNVLAPVRLSAAALPAMLERGQGGIVNVSSIAGCQAVPYLATYSATKAFLTSFSQSLHEEVGHLGINVVALLPGMTRSEFHDVAGLDRSMVPSWAWLSAEEVAGAGLAGLEAGRAVCVPRLGYRALATISRLAPAGLNRKVAALVGRRL